MARGVAQSLGLRYLDTGAMYRAVTWAVLDRGIDPGDEAAVAALAGQVVLEVRTDPAAPTIAVDGTDVTAAVRSAAVTASVSSVSAVREVRRLMVERQRELIGAGGIVVEGRDIGTTVAPDATVKVFLTADADARAVRRGTEIAGRAPDAATLAETEADLRRRDTADSARTASPLRQAPDAVVVDSTSMDADAVVRRVLDLVTAASR